LLGEFHGANPSVVTCWVLFLLGGHVYRGTTFADLIGGAYVFGDNESKNVYYIKKDGDSWTVGTIISDGSVAMVGFTEDIDVRKTEEKLQSAK